VSSFSLLASSSIQDRTLVFKNVAKADRISESSAELLLTCSCAASLAYEAKTEGSYATANIFLLGLTFVSGPFR
jgi:hypothetical protein